jgi:hypothetical protein
MVFICQVQTVIQGAVAPLVAGFAVRARVSRMQISSLKINNDFNVSPVYVSFASSLL